MREIGTRVGAVQSADESEVRFYGFGTYDGDEVPPPGVQMMGIEVHEIGITNPKITLDSGKVVFGCECWWGDEERVRQMIGDRRIIEVDIETARAAQR